MFSNFSDCLSLEISNAATPGLPSSNLQAAYSPLAVRMDRQEFRRANLRASVGLVSVPFSKSNVARYMPLRSPCGGAPIPIQTAASLASKDCPQIVVSKNANRSGLNRIADSRYKVM